MGGDSEDIEKIVRDRGRDSEEIENMERIADLESWIGTSESDNVLVVFSLF